MLVDPTSHPLNPEIRDKNRTSEEITNQSPIKPFLIHNNEAVSFSSNTMLVPNDDEPDTNAPQVKNNKKSIKKWLILGVVLVLIVTIGTLLIVISKQSNKQVSTAQTVRQKGGKKVLFVIADGIPADVIENATIPNIKKIQNIGKYKRAYVGGENGSYSETFTVSAPGYMNLITGTWGNKHNVYDNDVKSPNYNYKNIFRLVKEQQSDKTIAIFSTWVDNRLKLIGEGLPNAGNIHFDYKFDGYELDQITFPHDPADFYIHLIDQRVADETEKCIKMNAPDISWVYLQYTDDTAHRYGDSDYFYQSVTDVDRQIGQMWNAIEYGIREYNESWLVIITTDHGRDPITGQDHGEQTLRERTTWIVTNSQETNSYFRDFEPGIVDILPTMARFMNLNIPVESARELDGVPLIGNVSLTDPHLTLSGDNLTIKWKVIDHTGNVTIWLSTTNLFKDGQKDDYTLIGTVPVHEQMAVFNINKYPSIFYKIVLEGRYNMVNKWVFRS